MRVRFTGDNQFLNFLFPSGFVGLLFAWCSPGFDLRKRVARVQERAGHPRFCRLCSPFTPPLRHHPEGTGLAVEPDRLLLAIAVRQWLDLGRVALTSEWNPTERTQASIYKRSDGRWVGAVTLATDRSARHRKVVYGRTQAEVRKKLRVVQHALDAGLPVDDGNLTVGAFLDRWLMVTLPGTVADSTAAEYGDVVRLYLKPGLGRK